MLAFHRPNFRIWLFSCLLAWKNHLGFCFFYAAKLSSAEKCSLFHFFGNTCKIFVINTIDRRPRSDVGKIWFHWFSRNFTGSADFTGSAEMLKKFTADVVYLSKSSVNPDQDSILWTDYEECVCMRLWHSCRVLFHSQQGLYAFVLCELFLFYLSACIMLVSAFISLRLAFTEGLIICNLHSGTGPAFSRLDGLLPIGLRAEGSPALRLLTQLTLLSKRLA